MARRTGRVANWVIALAALALLVAAGFALVQLVDDGSFVNQERVFLTVGTDTLLATDCETFRDGLTTMVTASA